MAREELCSRDDVAAWLGESWDNIQAVSQTCLQLPQRIQANQAAAADATETFVAELSQQSRKIIDMINTNHTSISLWLEEHKVTIARLVANISHDNQQELSYWKSKTEQLQLALENLQREQPRRLKELKEAIFASIDSYSSQTQQYVETSSHLVSEANRHTREREERCATTTPFSEVHSSLEIISRHQEQQKINSTSTTKNLCDEIHRLTAESNSALADISCHVDQQLEIVAAELIKECAAQRRIAEELQKTKRSGALEKLDADIKAFGEGRQVYLEHQTASIDRYSNAMEEIVTTFTTHAPPAVDACLSVASQAHHIIDTTIPTGLQMYTPTCKTPNQIQPDDFCQHWEQTNVEAVLTRFDASSASSSSISPV